MPLFFQAEQYKSMVNGLGCHYIRSNLRWQLQITLGVLQGANDWWLLAVYRGNQQKIRQHPGSQEVVQTKACCLIAFPNLPFSSVPLAIVPQMQ